MFDIDSEWSQKKFQFFDLWTQCQVTNIGQQSMDAIWQELTNYYSEPQRHYHTRLHILKCLKLYDSVKARLNSPETVEMSIWYHDVIYDTTRKDNEEKSTELFKLHAHGYLPDSVVQRVTDLIMATMHTREPIDQDMAYLQDIDLSSFGETLDNFFQDGEDLRKESPHLQDEQYYQGKVSFFQMLTNREKVFFTDYFSNLFEQNARENIKREIQRIMDSDLVTARQ